MFVLFGLFEDPPGNVHSYESTVRSHARTHFISRPAPVAVCIHALLLLLDTPRIHNVRITRTFEGTALVYTRSIHHPHNALTPSCPTDRDRVRPLALPLLPPYSYQFTLKKKMIIIKKNQPHHRRPVKNSRNARGWCNRGVKAHGERSETHRRQ